MNILLNTFKNSYNVFMNKILKFVISLLLIFAFVNSMTTSIAAERKQFNIGTGFIGSSMHSLGTVLAKNMQKELRMRVTARPYVGPSAFLPMVNNGELEMGLSSMGEASAAYNGIDTEAKKNVRTVARLFAMPFAFIVKKDSGIETISDLKGKRVVLDFVAAGALTSMSQTMLDAAGLDRNDIEVITVSGVGQGIEAVVEGNADAAPGSVSMAAVRKADATVGVKVLTLASDRFEERLATSSSSDIRPLMVGAGTYPGVETETRIFALDIFLVVPSTLDDNDVVKILDVLHANWDEMQQEFNGLSGSSPAEFVHSSQTVPYHPAAIDYYKNGNGVAKWDDVAEARNNELVDRWQ